MGELAWGPAQVDWQERINVERMRRERLAKSQAAMKKHGLAACLLVRPDNLRYTTSTKGVPFAGQMRYALVFADHKPIIYEHGPLKEHAMVHCTWIGEENWRDAYSWMGGAPGPVASLAEAKLFATSIFEDLKAKGLTQEKIGVDTLDELGRQALKELGLTLVSAQDAMMEARRTKTADEINCHKMAASFASVAFYNLARTLHPGMRETELASTAMKVMIDAGGEPAMSTPKIRSGPNCFEVYAAVTTDRILEAGDSLYMNVCGAIDHMGYLTCLYRDYCVGKKPSAKHIEWHKKCYDRIYAVIDAIKPGASTADAAIHFPPVETWGYTSERKVLTKEVGHAIGLSLFYEGPIINRLWSLDYPEVFEEGMVIAIECREGEPFVGGSRPEEMVVVTKTGTEVLCRVPCDEIITPWTFG